MVIDIFESYLTRVSGSGNTIGQAIKSQSDMLMAATWDRDLQTRDCYIYDYFHDSEKDKYIGLSPQLDNMKKKISAKYIITQYNSLSKDQVEYHIQFKPGDDVGLDYYDEFFRDKYNSEYPIELYIDIPDESGVYRKWLICSKDLNPQFTKFTILPCNYNFQWIDGGYKYSMCGVVRMKNSYNSGVWTDYLTTTVENQDQIWLPMNNISETLYYDKRIVISALITKPIVWIITKVENTHPFGVNKFTLSQSKFDANKDYINLITKEMYADYYDSAIEPTNPTPPPIYTGIYGVVSASGLQKIRYSGYKTFSVAYYNSDGTIINPPYDAISWSILVDGIDITLDTTAIKIEVLSDTSIKVYCLSESFVGKALTVKCSSVISLVGYVDSLDVEVVY